MQREVNIDLDQFDTADNVELDFLIKDAERWQEEMLGKKPVLVKKLYDHTKKGGNKPPRLNTSKGKKKPSLTSKTEREDAKKNGIERK